MGRLFYAYHLFHDFYFEKIGRRFLNKNHQKVHSAPNSNRGRRSVVECYEAKRYEQGYNNRSFISLFKTKISKRIPTFCCLKIYFLGFNTSDGNIYVALKIKYQD